MAAADEFPRGLWLTSAVSNSGIATVVFPAVAGVAWVLAEIDAVVYANTTNATLYNVTTSLTGGPQGVLVTPASLPATDSWSWSGSILGPLGVSIVVTFNVTAIVAITEVLNCYAFPV